MASLGVFIIAVPLSIGIALASGAPPAAGLIAAVVGGIAVGIFTGAPLVVSGPAAGLAALVFEFVNKFGLEGLAYITILGGILQFLFGAIKLGKLFTYVPKAVLNGMLAAIGVLIAAGQLHVMLGLGVPKSFLQGILALPTAFAQTISAQGLFPPVLILGLLAILIQVTWARTELKKIIPAALPAVLLVTLVSFFFSVPRVEIAPLFSTIADSSTTFFTTLSFDKIWLYIGPAIVLAIIASAETLLTARAVDGLSDAKKDSDLNQELLAQGVGNTLSGIIGGLPITGVIVRSGANVTFGAKTRLSTILHGAWVLLFVGIFPFLLETIPLTALAAVLIVTGFKLFNPVAVFNLSKRNNRYFLMWAATFLGIIFTNLLYGLVIGIFAAVILNAKQLMASVNSLQKTNKQPRSQKSFSA
jgi:MFS superfamily sulfate permease-like transporter